LKKSDAGNEQHVIPHRFS